MQSLFERHPLPWTCDEKVVSDYYFVVDANRKTIVMIGAIDETSRTEGLESEGMSDGVAFIVEKRPRRGSLQLARMVAALPDLMAALTDAHAALTGESDAPMADRLETLIEKLA